jgi:hypothetical protein
VPAITRQTQSRSPRCWILIERVDTWTEPECGVSPICHSIMTVTNPQQWRVMSYPRDQQSPTNHLVVPIINQSTHTHTHTFIQTSGTFRFNGLALVSSKTASRLIDADAPTPFCNASFARKDSARLPANQRPLVTPGRWKRREGGNTTCDYHCIQAKHCIASSETQGPVHRLHYVPCIEDIAADGGKRREL